MVLFSCEPVKNDKKFDEHGNLWYDVLHRDVAQFGRALSWGGRGRGFKSRRSDHSCEVKSLSSFADERL